MVDNLYHDLYAQWESVKMGRRDAGRNISSGVGQANACKLYHSGRASFRRALARPCYQIRADAGGRGCNLKIDFRRECVINIYSEKGN